MLTLLKAIAPILRRHLMVARSNILTTLVNNLGNPILYLFAFGFGLGAVIDEMEGIPYLNYVVPGIFAFAVMFTASFEGSIGSFSRFKFLKTWDATLATPITLGQLLFSEVVWGAMKAVFSGACVFLVGTIVGGVTHTATLLLVLLVSFVAGACFMACAMVATAYARWYDSFSYFFTFWVTPMFMFGGVFFSIDRFPIWLQWVCWALPMPHFIAIVRPLMADVPLDITSAALHLLHIIGFMTLAFFIAYRKVRQRMFD